MGSAPTQGSKQIKISQGAYPLSLNSCAYLHIATMPKVLINKNFVLCRYYRMTKVHHRESCLKTKVFYQILSLYLLLQQTIYQCVCTLYYTMDICLHDKFRHIEKKVGLVTASHLIYGERVDGKTLNAIISTFSKGVVPP